MSDAATLLASACTSGISCLDRRSLLIVVAELYRDDDNASVNDIQLAAAASGVAALGELQLLQVIAQLSAGEVNLDAACTNGVACLTPIDVLKVWAQSICDTCTADSVLAAAAASKVDALDNLSLLKLIAQILLTASGSTLAEVQSEACTSRIACLSQGDLLMILIAQAAAEGHQVNPILALPGLLGYWRADSFVSPNPPDGSSIGVAPDEWQDLSGNNNDLIHIPGGTDPAIEYNEINGLPAVKLDGVPLAENLGFTNAITLPGDLTLMMLLRDSAGNWATWVANRLINQYFGRYRAGANVGNFFDGVTDAISTAFATGTGSAYLYTVRRSGTTVSFRENKTARGTAVTTAASVTVHNLGIVSYSPSIANSVIGELVITNQFTSDASIDSMYDTWFKPRWGLP